MWLFFFFTTLCLVSAFGDGNPFKTVDGKSLYPSLRTFPNKQALVDSYLWNYFTQTTPDVTILATAIYLEDTKTILVLADPLARDLVSAGKELLGLSKKQTVSMTEIDLGPDIFSVGCDYYPLLTVSAEFSTGLATVEREVTQTHRVTFSPSVNHAFGLIVVSLKVVLGMTFGSELTERESITCAASPGGKVQLQVSNRMLHFPKARTRSLNYLIKLKEFEGLAWESVRLSVADEEHLGALFYQAFHLGKHRCVTNASHFENVGVRKWLEWSEPYPVPL